MLESLNNNAVDKIVDSLFIVARTLYKSLGPTLLSNA